MDTLPPEIHVMLANLLDPKDIVNLVYTCRLMHDMYSVSDAYRGSLLSRSIIRNIEEDLPIYIEYLDLEEARHRFNHSGSINLTRMTLFYDAVRAHKQFSRFTPDKQARIRNRTELVMDLGGRHIGGLLRSVKTNPSRWMTTKIFWELMYSLLVASDPTVNQQGQSTHDVIVTAESYGLGRRSNTTHKKTLAPWTGKMLGYDCTQLDILRVLAAAGGDWLFSTAESEPVLSLYLDQIVRPPRNQLLLYACTWLNAEMVDILLAVETPEKWDLQKAMDATIYTPGTTEAITEARNRILTALYKASGGTASPQAESWNVLWKRYHIPTDHYANVENDKMFHQTLKTLFEVGTPLGESENLSRVIRWVLDRFTHASFNSNGQYVHECFEIAQDLLIMFFEKGNVDPNIPLSQKEVQLNSTIVLEAVTVTYTIRPLHYLLLRLNEYSTISSTDAQVQDYIVRHSQLPFAVLCLVLRGADSTLSRSSHHTDVRHRSLTGGRMIEAYTPIAMASCLGPRAYRIIHALLGVSEDPGPADDAVLQNYRAREYLAYDESKMDYTSLVTVDEGHLEVFTPYYRLKPDGEYNINALMLPNKLIDPVPRMYFEGMQPIPKFIRNRHQWHNFDPFDDDVFDANINDPNEHHGPGNMQIVGNVGPLLGAPNQWQFAVNGQPQPHIEDEGFQMFVGQAPEPWGMPAVFQNFAGEAPVPFDPMNLNLPANLEVVWHVPQAHPPLPAFDLHQTGNLNPLAVTFEPGSFADLLMENMEGVETEEAEPDEEELEATNAYNQFIDLIMQQMDSEDA